MEGRYEECHFDVPQFAERHYVKCHSAQRLSTLLSNPNNIFRSPKSGPTLRPIRVRIVMVGSERSGKSCLIKRYCEKRFVSKYLPTIGIDYGATKIYVDKVNVTNFSFSPGDEERTQDIFVIFINLPLSYSSSQAEL
jgi:GTPase SAR1 family protein